MNYLNFLLRKLFGIIRNPGHSLTYQRRSIGHSPNNPARLSKSLAEIFHRNPRRNGNHNLTFIHRITNFFHHCIQLLRLHCQHQIFTGGSAGPVILRRLYICPGCNILNLFLISCRKGNLLWTVYPQKSL